jgi:RHS repeat-associated protein
MLASSFLDPVLGIDIHFEMVPTPAPVPTPIPNPFIGVVFDPIGLAAGIAIGAAIGAVVGAPFQGPVLYWTAFPATNTGTEAKHVPGHILIPPGVAWAPFPKTPKPVIHPGETPTPALPVKPENDAVVITGSKTVTVMGSNAVRLGDIALSCSEPLRLPSSVVLAIPKGAPILIGGPPSLDIMAALMASLRTRFVSDSLHALLSRLKPSRFRNFLNRVVCFFTGHPVDVATGKVMTQFVDAELPGPLPLKIERIYSSAFAARPGPVGHGWSLSLDQAIWRERGKVVLLAEDGRELEFDTFDLPEHRIEPGQRVYDPIHRLTLHCEKHDAWRVVDPEGNVREFAPVPGRRDERAMIQRIRSRCGFHEITFHYASAGASAAAQDSQPHAIGRLEWVRDGAGRLLHLRYDAQGRLCELWLPQPQGEGLYRHRIYEYDAAGDLVSVTDPLGHAWRFAYVTHLLTQETDRNGSSFYFAYDGLGEDAWCVRTWGDGGVYDHALAYDKHKHVTFVTNSLGFTTQYHMNLVGQVIEIVDPLGGTTEYAYDPVTLRRTKEIDALGHETAYAYDARGHGTAIALPSGATLRFEYDEHGRLVHAMDANGSQWSWRHDAHGRLIARRACDGSEQTYDYEGARLLGITEPDGRRTRFGYDRQGLVDTLHAPDGTTTTWRHDALGRTIQAINPRGNVIRFRHDLLGRPTEIHEPDGNVRTLTYDAEGNPIRAKDAHRDASFTYSATGRVTSRTEAGITVRFEYDTEEHLRGVVNEHGRAYGFELDPRGDVIAESSFDGVRRTYERDRAGRPTKILRPLGSSTYRYDAMGRIVELAHSDGSSETFVYGLDGTLLEASNAAATVRFERDPLGRIACEWQDEHWVRSAYDRGGERALVRSSLGSVQAIERDTRGNATGLRYWDTAGDSGRSLASTADWQLRIERDVMGLELERQLPGGVRSRWARDSLGRPLQHQLASDTETLRDVRYQWGVDNRLGSVVDAMRGLQTSYGHDALGNLAGARQGEAPAELRMPDAVGNLFRRSDRADRRYGPCGELQEAATPAGIRRYVHDTEGNLVERHEPDGGVWRFGWSLAGRLARVERPDGRVVTLEYDALGRRVRKHFDGRTTHWIWDGNLPIHEWTTGTGSREAPAPDALVTWIFEPGSFAPAGKLTAGSRSSIVTDHVGAPVAMLDATGRAVWAGELDVLGRLQPTIEGVDPHACPFRWPGQYEDAETGLYYNRYRYYDPDAGSYISRDPIGLGGDLAPYRYVVDPLRFIDPLGLMPWAWNGDTGMGHHLVPRGKANSAGMPLLGTDRHTPTFFPNPYTAGDHEAIHRAQKPHIGALQGPWTGTPDELLQASKKGLDDVAHLRGDLKIPATGEVLAKNVTPAQAFDELVKWHDAEKKKSSCT